MTDTPLTSTQQKELQDFRQSLTEEQQEQYDRIVEAEGESAVYAKLGHLKAQIEYINSL